MNDAIQSMYENNYCQDLRKQNIEVKLELPAKEIDNMNKDLYVKMNNSIYGYESSDELVVNLFGIKFEILPENGSIA
jgi:hypothetical protein